MKFLKLSAALALCAAGCGGTQVRRMDVNEVKDVSGRWNDTDARLVAEEMIQDSMSRPWLSTAQSRKGGPPAVIVQTVRNNSMEHINTDVFVEELQRALINSGRIQFVASSEELGEIRGERADQDLNASDETRNTPVVVLSNFSEPTLIKRALQLGALEYVIKTQVEGSALLQAVPRWMNREKAFAAA